MYNGIVKITLALAWLPTQLFAGTNVAWVGTYTSSTAPVESRGIYSFSWDSDTGSISAPREAVATGNPSFIALHPNGRFLYAVNEEATGQGRITAFAIGRGAASGTLAALGSESSLGAAPCHLSIDPKGRWLFVANYLSGNITVYPILADGRLRPAVQNIQQRGSGPDLGRQESAHAHEVVLSPDSRFLLSVDLGSDKIFVYRFDPATGVLTPNSPATAAFSAGAGPRHVVFSRNASRAYVITELTSEIITLRWNARRGTLETLASTPTLAPDYQGKKSGAEIALHPNGKFLYASNRDDSNTISIFRLRPDGIPVQVGRVSAGGRSPRFFAIDPSGRYIIVANQNSNDLVEFRIDSRSGELTRTGSAVSIPAPVDVVFMRSP